MHYRSRLAALGTLLAVALFAVACGNGESTGTDGDGAQPVTVYIGRHYGIEPVFAEFTEATGIPVEFTTGRDPELRERLGVEGDRTRADVYLAADAGNLELAARDGLLTPAKSAVLDDAIPENFRNPEGRWFALSLRARTIMTSSERVADADVPRSYAALADPRWKGRLCLRPSTSPYTQSLVASIIANEGEARARAVVEGWVANDPTYIDSDVDILKGIADGRCDAALTNHYYLARIIDENGPQRVRISWPTEGAGTHVNVSGAGIVTAAGNPDGARRLLEWLATDGQRSFSDVNFEFPANPAFEPAPAIAAFGDYRVDAIPTSRFGELQAQAVTLLDQAGYQ
jgi:iron(III) transport system substrate-binding protein